MTSPLDLDAITAVGQREFRVIVTGTRRNDDVVRVTVFDALDAVAEEAAATGRLIRIVHGQCRYGGADLFADQWAERHPNASAERHPASNHASPPARNTHMVELGGDRCVGFPAAGSRGTWDCLRKALDAGIPVQVEAIMPHCPGGAS